MHKIYSIKGSIDTEAVRACVADGVKAAIDAMSDESLTEMMRAPLQDFAHQEQAAAYPPPLTQEPASAGFFATRNGLLMATERPLIHKDL